MIIDLIGQFKHRLTFLANLGGDIQLFCYRVTHYLFFSLRMCSGQDLYLSIGSPFDHPIKDFLQQQGLVITERACKAVGNMKVLETFSFLNRMMDTKGVEFVAIYQV